MDEKFSGNVLAIETSGRDVGIALYRRGGEILERFLTPGQRPSSGLLPLIMTLLDDVKTKIAEIKSFVVDIGPGSFTGIRIGISVVLGFSYALRKSAIGVSSFDVIANSVQTDYPHVVWIDAKQGEVYHAVYEYKNGAPVIKSGTVAGKPEKILNGIREKSLFSGDGAERYRDMILGVLGTDAIFNSPQITSPSPSVLCMTGLKRLLDVQKRDITDLVPIYLRDFEVDKN